MSSPSEAFAAAWAGLARRLAPPLPQASATTATHKDVNSTATIHQKTRLSVPVHAIIMIVCEWQSGTRPRTRGRKCARMEASRSPSRAEVRQSRLRTPSCRCCGQALRTRAGWWHEMPSAAACSCFLAQPWQPWLAGVSEDSSRREAMGNPILRYIEYIIVYACNIRKYTSIYIKGFSCTRMI